MCRVWGELEIGICLGCLDLKEMGFRIYIIDDDIYTFSNLIGVN